MDKNLPEVGVEEVRQVSREINIIASVLARSREELKSNERLAALAKLVPVVAHDVKKPLASIRANAQLLTRNCSIEELKKSKIAILTTVDKLTRWVNSLVSYMHPLQPRLEYFDLRKVVEGALMLSGAPRSPKNLSITYVDWLEPIRILADTDLLEQAIFCLLSNAVDASPIGGHIEIGILFRCDGVDLYILDQGDGMPFEYQPTDFKPGPSTKELGTSLGLPITQNICDAHKFGLKFEKGMKTGTRAVISIIKVIERENG